MEKSWVWITGATSGIGKALAEEYARNGFKVIASGRNVEKLVELSSRFPENCVIIPLDVTDEESRFAAIKTVQKHTQQLSVLIHSAGVSQRSKASETSLTTVKKLFEVNFFGLIELNRLCLPLLGSGSTIGVMSSLVGKFSTPFRTSYSASKHALDGYFDGLQYELNPEGIRICMIYPGYIKTDISINALTANGNSYGKMDKTQEQGMSAEKCAAEIFTGIQKGKRELIIGGSETNGLWLKRFFPGLLKKIIARKGITVQED